MIMLTTVLLLSSMLAAPPYVQASDSSIVVRRLAEAPVLDGHAEASYGSPTLRLPAANGDVLVWIAVHGEFVFVAARIPDSTFYWGDDLVLSVDPDGSGGDRPGDGDRQWYLRRVLDSSVVSQAVNGTWRAPGRPPTLGAARKGAGWEVATRSTPSEWSIELRLARADVQRCTARARVALRTYNDQPHGWWSWPAAPEGHTPTHVEGTPSLWIPLTLP